MLEKNNNYAFANFSHVINTANNGFFCVFASVKMQNHIADSYKNNNEIAFFNYSYNSEDYDASTLHDFYLQNIDKKIFFILNLQITLNPFLDQEEDFYRYKNLLNLNMSRDFLANKHKVWIFFLTPDMKFKLQDYAPDFYDYISKKISFEDVSEEKTKIEINNLSKDILTLNEIHQIKERLLRYKEIETEYLSYFTETPEGNILLKEGITKDRCLIAAQTLTNIAELYGKISNFETAISIYKKVILIRETFLGQEHPDTATSYNYLGLLYYNQGDYQKALKYYEKSLEIREKILGIDNIDTAMSYNNIGNLYDNQGDYQKALGYYEKALEILEKLLGIEHSYTAGIYNNIGLVFNNKGDYEKALEYFEKALEIREKILGKENIDTAGSYHNIGLLYANQGDYQEALKYYEKALKIKEKILGQEHPITAMNYNSIGALYFEQGNYQKALEYYEKALEILEKTVGEKNPKYKLVLKNIEEINKINNK
ncbi:MAG: tetratricopeptide repeat protein [Bacteroidales bacterium]|jgi:tetratricopeptide (TPR) repeat protein|nr:tetratricopeptide repeat protein [Bacteroidales bacterium]